MLVCPLGGVLPFRWHHGAVHGFEGFVALQLGLDGLEVELSVGDGIADVQNHRLQPVHNVVNAINLLPCRLCVTTREDDGGVLTPRHLTNEVKMNVRH